MKSISSELAKQRDRFGAHHRIETIERFYLMLNRAVAEGELNVETVAPVDDDLSAVYQYLIGSSGGSA